MQEDINSLLKLNNKIFRKSQVYLDKVLKEYKLSSGSYPYLLILRNHEGSSQNKISEELGYDKAMSARTIVKLIKIGYLYREKDDEDARANKLYLTDKAKDTIPKILVHLNELVGMITINLEEQEKTVTIESLNKILNNIKNIEI